jgi:hypothetical protein
VSTGSRENTGSQRARRGAPGSRLAGRRGTGHSGRCPAGFKGPAAEEEEEDRRPAPPRRAAYPVVARAHPADERVHSLVQAAGVLLQVWDGARGAKVEQELLTGLQPAAYILLQHLGAEVLRAAGLHGCALPLPARLPAREEPTFSKRRPAATTGPHRGGRDVLVRRRCLSRGAASCGDGAEQPPT